ncbi:MAG: BatA domain-containing protein, partial [Hyphomicrobiaceae bacterium]
MSFGALAFLNPALLGALALLPVIYWLLRTVPPRPRRIEFPATRILVGIENKDKTPSKTPWWLTLIRMLAAALLILALAEPVLNPNRDAALKGSGPVVLVVDNGWSAATRFNDRVGLVDRLISEAEAQSRPVMIAQTAPPARTQSLRIEAPADARSTAAALAAQPFAPRRLEAAQQIASALSGQANATIVWLSDGIDHDSEARVFANKLADLSGSSGAFVVVEQPSGQEALGATAGLGRDGRLEVTVLRAGGLARNGLALAFSARGQRLGEIPFSLATGAKSATTTFTLPLELRNQVTRVELAGERSAGSVHLLDARSRWNRIALISGENREQAQPLLAQLYYLDRALGPFSELVKPGNANLEEATRDAFRQNVSVMMLADIGTLAGEVEHEVDQWVKNGGVLVRFAGPRLEKGGDALLPVALRLGGRALGGALSWSTPQPLAPFDEKSLFAGLPTTGEITVNRQVLADPAALSSDVDIWARLKDGTPLVTSKRHGEGRMVLFHITANSDWSNLPLSGLFVDMLRRISTLGQPGGVAVGGVTMAAGAPQNNSAAVGDTSADVLTPRQVLDGYGVLRTPPATAQPIETSKIATLVPGVEHPPGFYGPEASPRALNVLNAKSVLAPLPSLPAKAEQRAYEGQTAEPMKPTLLALALGLLFLDILAVLLLQAGPFWRRQRPASAAIVVFMFIGFACLSPSPVAAQGFGDPPAAGENTRRPL